MSMSTSISYGYGFYLPEYEEEKFRQFIINHKQTILNRKYYDKEVYPVNQEIELLSDAENVSSDFSYDTLNNVYNTIISDETAVEGLPSIIANIIKDETDLRVHYETGDKALGSCPAIMLPALMPWQYDDNELCRDKNDVYNILKSYLCELTSKPEQYPIDYLSIEYYG